MLFGEAPPPAGPQPLAGPAEPQSGPAHSLSNWPRVRHQPRVRPSEQSIEESGSAQEACPPSLFGPLGSSRTHTEPTLAALSTFANLAPGFVTTGARLFHTRKSFLRRRFSEFAIPTFCRFSRTASVVLPVRHTTSVSGIVPSNRSCFAVYSGRSPPRATQFLQRMYSGAAASPRPGQTIWIPPAAGEASHSPQRPL